MSVLPICASDRFSTCDSPESATAPDMTKRAEPVSGPVKRRFISQASVRSSPSRNPFL